jgi:hypothetical protein
MSYFEECLRLGEWLSEADRRALYRYLLEFNKSTYAMQAKQLLKNSSLNRQVANGEILYSLSNNDVSYTARRIGSEEFTSQLRTIKLTRIRTIDSQRLKRFFAQSDVDVIQNFPLPGANPETEASFGIDAYPYYSLVYYSNGKSKLLGLINKIKTNDREILTKLRTL